MKMKSEHSVKIFGINYKDDKEDANKVLEQNGNPFYSIGTDEDGTQVINLGLYGVPETFLIHDKKILRKIIGPLNENDKNEIIELIK